jgi:hypothetical protein
VGRSPRVAGYTDRHQVSRSDGQEKLSGTPARIAGQVIGDTSRLSSRKLRLSVNAQTWTVSAPSAVFSVSESGKPLSVHRLRKGDWVVAEGMQTGDVSIRALAIRKLGDHQNQYRQSEFFRAEQSAGYVVAITAGTDFRTQARERILGARSPVAGERQEVE